jgi:hypothetical protein
MTDQLGWVIPTAGAVQWVSGMILAVALLRRGWHYGGAGLLPRTMARLAIVLFLAAAVELVVVIVIPRDLLERIELGHVAMAHWQIRATLLLSVAAWLLLLGAASWTGALGIGQRRRIAAAELRRRSERARTPERRQ